MRLAGPLHVLDEGLAFHIEVLAFAAFAWWCFPVGDTVPALLDRDARCNEARFGEAA